MARNLGLRRAQAGLECLDKRVPSDTKRLDRFDRQALRLVQETEEQMLGADLRVARTARLFLRRQDHMLGSTGERENARAGVSAGSSEERETKR